jgi:hypothetical protein
MALVMKQYLGLKTAAAMAAAICVQTNAKTTTKGICCEVQR